ncbi:HAD family hydrolase [Pseudorhizobium flavum]|jgi:phosphoglycolate phosphatase|uniref:Phosphoglycolate phosphatase n=1 Tax=Pseudorhizobium flavum TaxID=1335061 RepID=A0A7W9Z0W1_9HYPH|nr:HAD family hydrolase [Pseudorhizobium flavum]MBB6181111.1 phosphoglycolate phosphatase [Pseudorhizobium flavum]CAD6600025.1 HAD family hydrolase [Pseudorhizobium flavum]
MTGGRFPGIAGILFDKDGTLIRYDESWGPVNREAARIASAGDPDLEPRLLLAAGMDPVSGETRADSLLAAGNAAEIALGFAAAGSPIDAAELTVLLDDLFVRAVEYAVPVTDLRVLFRRLKAQGLKIGIASSDNESSIRRTAARFEIDGWVDFVAGYDSGFGTKPEAGMLLGFCASTGLEPRQVAMVGDNAHDLRMGQAAGAGLKVGVLTGTGTRDTLAALADICIDDITVLQSLLQG